MDAHGHTLDLSSFQCPTCKQAIASDGFCEEHRIGFVHGQAYFSRLTYELTRGEKRDPGSIACPNCRKNARSHGWCGKCRLGMIGNVAIKDKGSYRMAAHAVDILLAANKAVERCEFCAVAIVTDTRCPVCRITYKDGKPSPAVGTPSSTTP